jgi:hypothetical protein
MGTPDRNQQKLWEQRRDSDGWRVENQSEERGKPTDVDGTTRKDQVGFEATSKSIARTIQIMRIKDSRLTWKEASANRNDRFVDL